MLYCYQEIKHNNMLKNKSPQTIIIIKIEGVISNVKDTICRCRYCNISVYYFSNDLLFCSLQLTRQEHIQLIQQIRLILLDNWKSRKLIFQTQMQKKFQIIYMSMINTLSLLQADKYYIFICLIKLEKEFMLQLHTK